MMINTKRQYKDLTSQDIDLTRQHNYLSSQHN